MKRILYFIIVLIYSNIILATSTNNENAQNDELRLVKTQLITIKKENNVLKDSIKSINYRLSANTNSIHTLQDKISLFIKTVNDKNTSFTNEINKTKANLEETQENTKEEFQKNILYVIIFFIISVLGIFITNVFFRRRMKNGDDAITKIRDAQVKIKEESLNLDNKLISILEKKDINYGAQGDHSLAMKVADEVTRIEMNLYRMDNSIRGYKQLSKAVERIKNNFLAQGYEIVNLLGTTYNDGMRINADFIIDETLPEGSRIITSITKPQLNYQGQMIQKAIVTVSQNL